MYEDETSPSDVPGRRKRTAELSLVTSPPTFTATVSERTQPSMTATSFTHSGLQSPDLITSSDAQPTDNPIVTDENSTSYSTASQFSGTNDQPTDSPVSGTIALSATTEPPATLPPWLIKQSYTGDTTSDSSTLALTPSQIHLSTHDASVTRHLSTRSAASLGTTGERALTLDTASLPWIHCLSCMLVLRNPVCACHHVYSSLSACHRCNSERGSHGRYV